MGEKSFKVNFFQVDLMHNDGSFADLLTRAANLSEDQRNANDDIRLDNVEFDDRIRVWFGALIKIRMTNLPEKINQISGQRDLLPISDDEGIAEMSAFLYDPQINIILIQKSQFGPSISKLSDFFAEKFLTLPMDFRVILKTDVLEKLQRMDKLYRFELKAARLRPDLFANSRSVSGLLNSLGNTGYAKLDIKLSADKRTGLARWLKNFANTLATGISAEGIDRVKVGVTYRDGGGDMLDLLQCKMEEEVSLDNVPRTILFAARKEALYRIYTRTRGYLYDICRTH